jgi:hypothetical protein
MNAKKQPSHKVLMGLILLMFALQTIHSGCQWYITWLGFIYYSDSPEQALDAFQIDPLTTLWLRVAASLGDLITTLRLAIADSIMVSTHLPHPVSTTNSLQLKGLEVLDHMEQQLDSSNCPSGLKSWVNRYVTSIGDREHRADEQLQL